MVKISVVGKEALKFWAETNAFTIFQHQTNFHIDLGEGTLEERPEGQRDKETKTKCLLLYRKRTKRQRGKKTKTTGLCWTTIFET